MLLFLPLSALIWWGGALAGWSRRRRWLALAGLAAAFLLASAALPAGHPLRALTGDDPRGWLLVLIGGGLVALYRLALPAIRARGRALAGVAPAAQPTAEAAVDPRVLRHSRHILLREIGGPGQRRLREASVLVIGAGGLGGPVLQYLAAAGVGRITVIDPDRVEISNLQRQVIFAAADIGRPKAAAAAAALSRLDPQIEVTAMDAAFGPVNAADLVAGHDLIVEGTDSMAARRLANAACAAAGKPLVGGAISQWEGQVAVWDPARGGPCYACVFPTDPDPGLVPTCAEAGVLGPLPGVIGAVMAAEAIKILTGAGQPLRGRLMIWDAAWAEARVIAAARDPGCPVCGSLHPG